MSKDFYASYGAYKSYRTPGLKKSERLRLDREFWHPAEMRPDLSLLEVGSGTGQFLLYLQQKGVADFHGLDQDPKLPDILPAVVRDRFTVADALIWLDQNPDRRFDRIALFDVLEHFAAEDAAKLLNGLFSRLKPGGRILVRVPNAASPWGLAYQVGDVTHRTAFGPDSLRQVAVAAGGRVVSLHPSAEGTARRRVTEGLLHGLLNWLLVTKPAVWTANIIAVMAPDEGA